jgi:cytochrome P450
LVRHDRSLLPAAIDEGVRWEPPLTAISRLVTVDTEVAGVAMPAGAVVDAIIGAANRDPLRWEDPDRFDVVRPRQPNLAFAWGPHTCIGQHLARLETTIAVDAVLDRLPDLRLDADADPAPEMRGIGFRSPTSLPVVF